MVALVVILIILVVGGLITAGRSLRVVQQYEQGIVFRFGRVLPGTRGPGLTILRPIGDRMQKVNMQIIAMAVPAQEGITRDNVSVRVDAVVYFRVIDPIKAVVNVQNYMFAVSQLAQTSLRSIIGHCEMDQLLADGDTFNRELRRIIDEPTEGPWGIRVERVELKDVNLPEGMKRSMSRKAEAERERRARIISADGEYQASKRLAAAANVMARDPAALQRRLLRTVVGVAGERNSTLVMPVPVELLRFFDRMTPGANQPAAERTEPEDLGDAEVAEAEAEIAGVNVPELTENSIPPVPEVEPAPASAAGLPSALSALGAVIQPDLTPEPEPAGLPRYEAPAAPTATFPPADPGAATAPMDATADVEDTASFPGIDPASTNGAPNGAAEATGSNGVAEETKTPPVRKPRTSTPRKPRTPAKPRTTNGITNGERPPTPQADR